MLGSSIEKRKKLKKKQLTVTTSVKLHTLHGTFHTCSSVACMGYYTIGRGGRCMYVCRVGGMGRWCTVQGADRFEDRHSVAIDCWVQVDGVFSTAHILLLEPA